MTDEEKFERFNALCSHLDDEGAKLWHEYLLAEKRSIRKQALALLDRFISHLRGVDPHQLDAWIAAYSVAIRDTKLTTSRTYQQWAPVRFSLLREVLLPRLIQGYHQGDRAAVSHLVALSDHVYNTAPYDFYQKHHFPDNPCTFLEEALRVNPHDNLALQMLITRMYRSLDYTIHEVPWGVLMGELQSELDWIARFEQLVKRAGRLHEFQSFIERVRNYVIAWDGYQTLENKNQSFAAYLDCLGIPYRRHHEQRFWDQVDASYAEHDSDLCAEYADLEGTSADGLSD